MDEQIFNEFRMYFPSFAKQTISWRRTDRFEITCDFEDGTTAVFSIIDKALHWIEELGDVDELTFRKTLRSRILRKMDNACINQQELAARCGVTEATLSHYIQCHTTPSTYMLHKIARALGVHCSDILDF